MPRDLGGCDEAFPGSDSKVGELNRTPMEYGYALSRKATFCRGKNSSQSLLMIAGQVHSSYNEIMSQAENLGGWQEELVSVSQAGRKGYRSLSPEQAEWGIRLRVRMIWVVVILVFAIVSARVIYLQVFEASQQLLLSENNHIEQARLSAERGRILDRKGVVLAESVREVEVATSAAWVRRYPLGVAGASVVGYLSEVRPEELGCREGLCYYLGAEIGRAGVERVAEARLRGSDGGVIQEVDAVGTVVRERGRNEGEAGESVSLTLDATLQEIMYRVMSQAKVEDKPIRGAGVALSPNGEVLGLVSVPSYNPDEITKYLADTTESYFLNRAIAGTYPPGSVFKMVTAYAGLKKGVIDRETEIEDTGEIRVGEYRYGTWNFDQAGRTEGKLNVVRALARSNDIYFYRVGEMIGVNELVKMAREFGYGEATGIELPGEAAGIVPDPLWKERRTGERWFLGNTYHMAIGQGDLLVTPLQVARMTAAVVSGRVCPTVLLNGEKRECRDLGIATNDLETVKQGMKEVCQTGGTAFPFFDFEPYVLCKTGTAQHAGQKEKEDLPHAWITVAYPGENPSLILTILVEAGGEGSAVAGPIAKQILDEWKISGN